MNELTAYLQNIQPELMNITRLFGISDDCWPEGGQENVQEGEGQEESTRSLRFTWQAAEDAGNYVCRVRAGTRESCLSVPIPPEEADERLQTLHRKRAARRLCKQALYDLCRETTGVHPPWGSLTGIRPTHLIYEAMADGLSAEAAADALIRRFDITPEKASLLREIVHVQRQLPPPGDGWMDVYIGIPFCATRCTYCSFSSGEIGRGKLVEPYLTALFREMEAGAALLKDTGKRLRAVYVGGGTPTSLNEAQFARLLDKMMLLYPGAMEYTVEAGRPDTITPGKLRAIRAAGVGRISINPQTMNDRTLRFIGRGHTAAQVEEAYAMARAEGVGHINMDVIAGLPGEDTADFARTMEAALRLKPESLTVHTLAIKRSSRLHLESAPLPDGETAAAMVRMGLDTARRLGLQPYYLYRQKYMAGNQENVGYALPGHACQYNVDIMEENTHILALGAGGISKRIYPDEGHIGRSPNVSNIELYTERVAEMIARKRTLFLEEGGMDCEENPAAADSADGGRPAVPGPDAAQPTDGDQP